MTEPTATPTAPPRPRRDRRSSKNRLKKGRWWRDRCEAELARWTKIVRELPPKDVRHETALERARDWRRKLEQASEVLARRLADAGGAP